MKRAKRRRSVLQERIAKILVDTVRRHAKDKSALRAIARELDGMERIYSAVLP